MSDNEIVVFRIGVPGPPGTGITSEELAALQADIAALFTGSYRGQPIRAGKELVEPFDAFTMTGDYVPEVSTTIADLDATKWHRVEIRGRAKVSTVADTTLTMRVALAGIVNGPVVVTPTAAGTYGLKFYGTWDRAPGPTSFQALAHYQTDQDVDVTFHEVELELTVTRQTL